MIDGGGSGVKTQLNMQTLIERNADCNTRPDLTDAEASSLHFIIRFGTVTAKSDLHSDEQLKFKTNNFLSQYHKFCS